MTQKQRQKGQAIEVLRRHFAEQREQLREIDSRLEQYFSDVCEHSSIEEGDENDRHNLYEVLGAVKFLRLLRTYEFNTQKVQKVISLREGKWRRTADGHWEYEGGGIKCPGTSGEKVYRWQPWQVMALSSVFGFKTWIDTRVNAGEREMLKTEKVSEGRIYDLRRLCTDFTAFLPRKTDKTGLSAYIQLWFFFFEDYNAEIYCCANAKSQAELLYNRTRQMMQQIDNTNRLRKTATVCDWRQQYKGVHNSELRPLSAGGKTKDGMFAQLCCADEFGSSPYVKERSDMKALVDVVMSSTGPRREPLLFTTTTAGRITAGPFIDKLEALHRLLEKEIDYAYGIDSPELSGDRTLALLLEPDEWEKQDEQLLLSSRTVRRKVNPMLGLTVQHQSYDDEIAKARLSGDTGEVISKYFNVYQSARTTEWLKAEQIRALQIERRIDECTEQEGWTVFAGMDFSKGDDLNGVSYLAMRWREDGEAEFYADMDSYMSQEAVESSPIRELLRQWAERGWLHIVPGKTFDPSWPVNRIINLHHKGVNFLGFGYDPYNAKTVVNALGQWLFDIGVDPKQVISPVRQNFASYNSAVNEFDYMVKRAGADGEPRPMIRFSQNPMWPWQFSNTVLAVSNDGMENRKPVKGAAASAKVDNVQMLLSALILYDAAESAMTN